MNTQDFQISITAIVTAEEAMLAVSQVQDWWAKDFTGSAKNLNDEFTVRFGETFVSFKITELLPNVKVVWTVTNCYLPWLNDKTEWNETNAVFEIIPENNQTIINFIHQGLVPQIECYDTCVKGWTRHVTGSLLKLLTTGVGEPA